MATSEMPWGEPRFDSPFLPVSRKVARISRCSSIAASAGCCCLSDRDRPVKPASVIGPRSSCLINCLTVGEKTRQSVSLSRRISEDKGWDEKRKLLKNLQHPLQTKWNEQTKKRKRKKKIWRESRRRFVVVLGGLLSWKTIHGSVSGEKCWRVSVCVCVCVSSHTATGWLRYSVHPRASPRVTCKGFENGRRSYELVLEDNYDGDPKTTIYYVVTRGSG